MCASQSQGAPVQPSPPTAKSRPEVLNQLDKFWMRVTEGLELSQLWKQFRTEARTSYRLYQKDFKARSPRGTRRKDVWHTAQEFAWALLEKLTPARRVLLLLGLVLLLFPAGGYSHRNE